MPRRRLTRHELMRVAELQANRLLEAAELFGPPVPSRLIEQLPKLIVEYMKDIPVSGSTHWTGSDWLIVVNADEIRTRQRFSMAHELKHVLDHPVAEVIFSPSYSRTQRKATEEYMADYFAACLLMPKRMVKRALSEGIVHARSLAGLFEVSLPAMERRMRDLGLTPITAAEEIAA